MLLGHRLDDKVPTDLYELHRDDLGWRWAVDEPPVAFEVKRVAGQPDAGTVTLVCSISGTVPSDHLPEGTTTNAGVYELRPR